MKDIIFSYGIEETFTPLDGRNHHKLLSLTPYFSELALTKYRVRIECMYLQKLAEYKVIRKFTAQEIALLKKLGNEITAADYKRIRTIEQSTNHEMKSVEEFIKEKLQKTTLKDVAEMVHFGLTSEDINNLAYSLMLKDSLSFVLIPEIEKVHTLLLENAKNIKVHLCSQEPMANQQPLQQ